MIRNLIVLLALTGARAMAQSAGPVPEFDAASIHTNPPRSGFHFASETVTGGPGTADPGLFRCSGCSLATLIARAFALKPWQFPGRASLTDNTFDVMARIPATATQEQFQAMLQNLLTARFGLTWHYTQKSMRGYHLVIAAKGLKLKASSDSESPRQAAAGQHQFGAGEGHSHSAPLILHGSAIWRRDHQTIADLVQVISDQLNVPVDDQTNLSGSYDIALTWAAGPASATGHSDAAWGDGHGYHGSDGGAAPAGGTADGAPGLSEALQSQLGLQLVPSGQAMVQVFTVDHVQALPSEN